MTSLPIYWSWMWSTNIIVTLNGKKGTSFLWNCNWLFVQEVYSSLSHQQTSRSDRINIWILQIMKFVILLVATFCCTIYSTYGQTASEEECEAKQYKSCHHKCVLDVTATRHCCPISRCIKCYKAIGLDKCGLAIQNKLMITIVAYTAIWRKEGCTESEMYPSTKCLYYFYTAWFYVVPLLIVAVIGVVVFVVRRRRRRRRRRRF